ncbi:MAG: nucleoside monophosphate kinase [Patescibacteria group bacterium]
METIDLNNPLKPALVIFGAQGSGKSTQSSIIAKQFDLTIFESGEQLRALAASNEADEPSSKDLRSKLARGDLIDDQTIQIIWERFLLTQPKDKGIVLDGFPRNIHQCEELERVARKRQWQIIGVYLKIPDSIAKSRLLARHRMDDTPQIIEERLALFHRRTEPVLKWLEVNGQLLLIDGQPSAEQVSSDVLARLEKLIAGVRGE